MYHAHHLRYIVKLNKFVGGDLLRLQVRLMTGFRKDSKCCKFANRFAYMHRLHGLICCISDNNSWNSFSHAIVTWPGKVR
jgi:hypothetical protein